jgi:hypothetical protein
MDLEDEYKSYLFFGTMCLLCSIVVTLGGVDRVGIWMDAMYPLFLLFSIACFSIAWIRYNKKDKKT